MIKWICFNSTSAILVIVLLISCKLNLVEILHQKVAFDHSTMKPWFDTNCSTCHAKDRSNYLNWHFNLQDFEASFNPHFLSKFYERVYVKKDIPKDRILSLTELVKFKAWPDAGFPSK